MFCARAWIFTEKNATSKIIKKSPKNQFPPGGAVFALAPPSPKPTPPKGHFWRYLRCFMHIEQSSKMTVFLPPGRGSAAAARPPIAKAKAKPHAMRSNMPGIRCLAKWSGASCAGLVTYNLVIPTYAVLVISEVRNVITIVISSVTRKQFSKITSFCTYTSFSLKKEIFLLQFCCICVFKAFFCALFF